MRDLQPGKLKNKLTVRAKMITKDCCDECWTDIVKTAEEAGIKFEVEKDGSFPMTLSSFHWHQNNTCPHNQEFKDKRQFVSAYV